MVVSLWTNVARCRSINLCRSYRRRYKGDFLMIVIVILYVAIAALTAMGLGYMDDWDKGDEPGALTAASLLWPITAIFFIGWGLSTVFSYIAKLGKTMR